MRKSAGFTLIELVIVIVILGILGAVAAPRFMNMQDDAYDANVKSLAGSLQSAATLAHTKAILEGNDGNGGSDGLTVDGYPGVKFKFGYPIADTTDGGKLSLSNSESDGILGTLQSLPNDNDYHMSTAEGVLTIYPKSRQGNECYVKYTEATSSDKPAKVEYKANCNTATPAP